MPGWIKLHRQIQNNKLWHSEPFNKSLAWIDLLLLANHKEGIFFKRGVEIMVKKGEVGYSEDTLAARWKWSRGKVRRFLKMLENEQQIIQQKNNVTTLISIINYNEYQMNDTASSTASSTANGQQTDTNKKEEKEKKEKNIKKREEKFKISLAPYLKKYGRDTLNNFFGYWTEHGDNDFKMRFEKEKSFGIGRRLSVWAKREKDFPGNKPSEKTLQAIK